MNCEAFQVQIDDFVDGTLDVASEQQLVAHLATCPACRALADDFNAIRLTARRLEQPFPPDRVWTKLSAAIKAEHRQQYRWRAFTSDARWQTAAAAATLILAIGAVTCIAWPPVVPAPSFLRSPPLGSPADPDLARTVETELMLAEEHYEKAIAGLEQITEAGRGALDPQVAAVLQKNLAVIDQAIGESRRALRTQPASEVARESLFGALRSKVALLQETVSLISEMRKGNQEGAARIVSGLNK